MNLLNDKVFLTDHKLKSLFPSQFPRKVADYILKDLKDGCANKSFLYERIVEYCNWKARQDLDGVLDNTIAILLDNHLIEKWEYQEDDGTMIDYYDLPEDGDEI